MKSPKHNLTQSQVPKTNISTINSLTNLVIIYFQVFVLPNLE